MEPHCDDGWNGQAHAACRGPAAGDVVAVTEEVVLLAINEGKLTAGEALSLGFIRLYGSDGDVASARTWLQATDNYKRGSGS